MWNRICGLINICYELLSLYPLLQTRIYARTKWNYAKLKICRVFVVADNTRKRSWVSLQECFRCSWIFATLDIGYRLRVHGIEIYAKYPHNAIRAFKKSTLCGGWAVFHIRTKPNAANNVSYQFFQRFVFTFSKPLSELTVRFYLGYKELHNVLRNYFD